MVRFEPLNASPKHTRQAKIASVAFFHLINSVDGGGGEAREDGEDERQVESNTLRIDSHDVYWRFVT